MPTLPTRAARGRWRPLFLVPLFALLLLPLAACSVTNVTLGAGCKPPSGTTIVPGEGKGDLPKGGYSPRQMRIAYGVQSLCEQGYTGLGQTVVLIESFGSPRLQQDLDDYSKQFNLPPIKLDIRAPLGTKPFDSKNDDMFGWAVETTLDAEMIHAIAPDAGIVVLTSPVAETEGVEGLPEFRKLQQYAVDNHLGSVISQSYGASELSLDDAAGRDEVQKWNDFYQKATTEQGITFVAASGDGGATDYRSTEDYRNHKLANVATTGFPASSPWNLTVGGTVLTVDGDTVRETAWSGSGGGFSKFAEAPSYQQSLPSAVQGELQNRRGVPDVAASADPRSGLTLVLNGRQFVVGGTSAAAPLWAALIAIGNQMAGHSLGYVNPAIYKIGTSEKAAQDFRDITSGNNSQPQAGVQGYDAVAGWDPVTGFGSPIADKLLPDIVAGG